ncbi:MAG: MBL fold metallo-hydrolase [Acidimicrobiales bacterium]
MRYGGHTSCLAFAHDGERPSLIVDAGSGIRLVGDFFQPDKTIFGSAPFAGAILLSHLHFDHTQGIPFFGAGNHEGSRVDLFAPVEADVEASIERFLAPPFFPIGPNQLLGAWQYQRLVTGEVKIEGFSVSVRAIPHSESTTFGFRISDGGSGVAYLADHAPARLGPGPLGFGEYHPDAVALAEGCSVIFHDSQYTDEELAGRPSPRHSSPGYAVGLGEVAEVERVLLTHHHPERTDDEIDAIVESYRSAQSFVDASAVGTVIDL